MTEHLTNDGKNRLRARILRLGIGARASRDVADQLLTVAEDADREACNHERALSDFLTAARGSWPDAADEIDQIAKEATR